MSTKTSIVLIVGTRPEAILISSGRHREMPAQALAMCGFKPDIDLAIMQPGQMRSDLTVRAITSRPSRRLPNVAVRLPIAPESEKRFA